MGYERLAGLVEDIITAAIVADMHDNNASGSIEDGFFTHAVRTPPEGHVPEVYFGGPTPEVHIAPPGAPDAGIPIDQNGDRVGLHFDPLEVYEFWQEAVPRIFKAWLDLPDPDAIAAKVATVGDVATLLSGGGAVLDGAGHNAQISIGNEDLDNDLTYIEAEITKYDGAAMVAFKEAYAYSMRNVVGGDCAVASLLGIVIKGEEEIWRQARLDIVTLAEETLAAFESVGNGGGFDLKLLLKVVAFGASVVTGFLTGGASTVVGTIGATAGFLESFLPAQPADVDQVLEGGTAREVKARLEEGLVLFSRHIATQELAFRDCAAAAHLRVIEHVGGFRLPEAEPPDPSLPAVVPSDIEILPFLVVVAEHVDSVANTMTNAIDLLDEAAGDAPWERQRQIGLSHRGHYFEWEILKDRLQTTVHTNAGLLHAAAESLREVARDFAVTDDGVAAAMPQLPPELPQTA